MGWESYLSPNSDFSDFDIHRAQMRHYDDFTERTVQVAPGQWVPSSSSSGGGGHVEISAGSAREVAVPGKYQFRSSKLPDLEDVDGTFDNMELTQVMQPEVTSGKLFGLTWEANPYFSDVEEWAEKRYGDIGGVVAVPFVGAGDVGWNLARLTNWATGGWLDQPLPKMGADLVDALSPRPVPVFNMHSTVVGADGQVYRTGGGF